MNQNHRVAVRWVIKKNAETKKTETIMKKNSKTTLAVLAAGAFALASLSASANSITLGTGTGSPVLGGGGSQWTYEYTFANSTIIKDDSYFTINDFGPATVITSPTMPGGSWVFSQALSGPNSLTVADDGSVMNATFTWTGTTTDVTDGFATFTLQSLQATLDSQLHDYTSLDQSTTAKTASKVYGQVGTPLTTGLPDGGSSIALLGFGLVGMGALRRKLKA